MDELKLQQIKDEWNRLELALSQSLHSGQVPSMFIPIIEKFLDGLLKDFRELMK